MKRFCIIQFLVVILVSAFLLSDSLALGLGGYITSGSGSGEWTAEYPNGSENDFDTDDSGSGFGFVLDTAVAKNKLFNYRLGLGFESKDYEDESGSSLEIDSFVVENDFGFGVMRTPNLRLWLGPELKISSGTGNVDGIENIDYDLVSVGIGPVLGLNINIGKLITLGFKTGYLFESIFGQGKVDFTGETIDYTGDDTYFYLNFAIIFRINDKYSK
jgi:hypothetical protein